MKNLTRACVARPNRNDHRIQIFLVSIFFVSGVFLSSADARRTMSTSHGRNYDEANVGNYTVPDPFLCKDGRRVTDVDSWITIRRKEILRDFRDLMYGHTPKLPVTLRSEVIAIRKDAVNGLATRTLVTLRFYDDPNAPHINLMLYVRSEGSTDSQEFQRQALARQPYPSSPSSLTS